MMIIRLFLFFIFLVHFTQINAQELIRTYYDKDETIPREEYEAIINKADTIRHGNYLIYHTDGSLWQKGAFKKGLRDCQGLR